jgi:hypothetical protein
LDIGVQQQMRSTRQPRGIFARSGIFHRAVRQARERLDIPEREFSAHAKTRDCIASGATFEKSEFDHALLS